MRKPWDAYFIDIAFAVAERSTCPRRQVGAVLVKNNDIQTTGYNGAPRNMQHCNHYGCMMEHGHCVRTVHAEANALLRAAPDQMEGARLYVTDWPCYECGLLIANTGIVAVIAGRDYRDHSRSKKHPLVEAGIPVTLHGNYEEKQAA